MTIKLGVFNGDNCLTEGEGDVAEFDKGAVLGGVYFVEFDAVSISDVRCLGTGLVVRDDGAGKSLKIYK